jgi:hypothetical protein
MVYTITAEADTRLCCSYDLCDIVGEVLNGGALHEGEEGGEQDQQRLPTHEHCATSKYLILEIDTTRDIKPRSV